MEDQTNTLDTSTPNESSEAPVEATPEAEGNVDVEAGESKGDALYAGKYTSIDELEKAYGEAQKKITDVTSKSSEKYNALVNRIAQDQGVPVDDVLNVIKEEMTKEPTAEDELKSLRDEVKEMKFRESHQEAKEHIDLIRNTAKSKDLTLEEAYREPAIKRVLELEQELRQFKEGTSVVHTNKKVASDKNEYHDNMDKFKSTPRNGEGRRKVLNELLRQKGVLFEKDRG